ncbi:MAG: VWA domain-containing protein [Rhodospirillaceae bacterium]|nr:VWA domain-containing protein [Rhodospirillaceae bacterium]
MTRRIRLMAGAACIALIAGIAACSQQEERDTSSTGDSSERGKETAQTTTVDDGTVVIQPYSTEPEPDTELSRDEGLASGSLMVAESPSNQIVYAPTPVYPGERYAELEEAGVFAVAEAPVSTFSVDVDTGAYANIRRMLNDGYLPPEDAVRIEELINYFDYGYVDAPDADHPFSINTAVARTPWNEDTYLLQVGLKGFEPAAEDHPAANLVFLVDVSGSMEPQDKLPLVKSALRLLVNELRPQDSVALVTYAGSSGIALEPTSGANKATILAAIDRLGAGGSTNGAGGLIDAYALAEKAMIEGGANRVILATDGDFNVGITDQQQLEDLIEAKRKSGIALTTLGVGDGNYNEPALEQLADLGNGNYAYLDTLREAQKVLVKEMGSTLFTIAQDVKIQIEFNPSVVAEYRLIGYENRMLEREDFNNDRIDAGEIGAGHTVTALYEIALVGQEGRLIDPLRFGTSHEDSSPNFGVDFAFLRLRYKLPGEDESRLIEQTLAGSDLAAAEQPGPDLARAASVAAFGQLLRGGDHAGSFEYEDIAALAESVPTEGRSGDWGEFIDLVQLAEALDR